MEAGKSYTKTVISVLFSLKISTNKIISSAAIPRRNQGVCKARLTKSTIFLMHGWTPLKMPLLLLWQNDMLGALAKGKP